MKYLCFVRSAESLRDPGPPPEMMAAMGEFVARCRRAGTLVDTGGLLPSEHGAQLRLADGRVSVTDGPFAESKEVIGGWAILEAATKAAAIALATEFLELHARHWPAFEGEAEVRAMFAPPEPER